MMLIAPLEKKNQWNFIRITYILFQENPYNNVVWKISAICLGLDVLRTFFIPDRKLTSLPPLQEFPPTGKKRWTS